MRPHPLPSCCSVWGFAILGWLLGGGTVAAQHNYAAAFQQALYWYEAQTSGATPLDHRVEWRGDSAMRDGSDVGRDLTGGWYDAGDGVVWTSNDAFGASLLAWSLYRDNDVYVSTGQYQRAIDRLREINNYFAKIVDESGPGGAIVRIYVGKGSIKDNPPDDPAVSNDRTALIPHEVMDTPVGGTPQMIRPSYWVDATTGGADVAGSLSAALAASSIAFRDYGDTATADALLARARKVYAWGEANPNSTTTTRRMTNGSVVTLASYPVRSADWTPRMIYGAAWLHRAELEAGTPGYTAGYADKAESLYNSTGNANYRGKPWLSFEQPGQQMGAYAMLASDTGRSAFVSETNAYANFWAYRRSNNTGLTTDITLTPGGFLARNRPADANGGGWNTNYLMDQAPPLLDWAESPHNTNATLKNDLKALFKGQLAYLLGSNPKGKSYLQGYDAPGGGSADWFMNAHYRANLAAYGGFGAGAPATNAYPCYGLLIPGPGHTDEYPDTAPAIDGQIKYKEPIIYSGGLLTVLAQKIRDDGAAAGAVPGVFPPWIDRGANYQTEGFFVQAYREDGIVSNGIRLQVALNNRASLPAREINTLAFRYYYTPDGVVGTAVSASAVLIGGLSGETITVHGPTQVGATSTWYYEFRYNNAYIVPGEYSRYRRRAQIDIMQSGGTFSLANDHSGDTVAANATYSTIGDMPVYDFSTAKLLGGFEPTAGYIQWRRAHFNNVNEHASTVTLIAERVGGSSGAVSATVGLTSGTATAGADFTVPGNLTLSWAAGETGEKTLAVPLVEDPYDEGRHYFTATLGSLTGGAAAGVVTEARVSIEDNDFGGAPDPGGLVQVLGNAQIIAHNDATPSTADHTDFGSATINYPSAEVTRTFTIRNNDSTPLNLTGSPRVQITGANASEFTLVTPPPASVPVQGTVTFQVKFAPTSLGSRTATITIPTSSGSVPSYQFAIKGAGLAAAPLAQVAQVGAVVAPGASGSASAVLSNLGSASLTWDASLPANYTATSSSAPDGPTYQWIDISTTGNVVWAPTSSDLDDTTSSAINLPFAIPFYGTNRSQFKVCTNGWLTFDTATTANDWSNLIIPFSGNTNSRPSSQSVFPWWDDLYLLGNLSKVVWKQTDPDTVVIQWHNVTYYTWRFTAGSNPAQRFSFQVLLRRNGEIICQYKDVLASPDSNRYTIGLQNANATGQWLQYAYNTPTAETGVALRFSPPPNGSYDPAGATANWAVFSGSTNGTATVGGTGSIGLTFNTTGLVSGQTYRTDLSLTTNDPSQPTLTVPVTLTVSGLYNLASAGVANRAWETPSHWAPGTAYPGPADRWNLTTGGGSIDLRGNRSLGDATVNAASAVTINGQGIGGTGSVSSLDLNGTTLVQQGGLLVGGWNAVLRANGPLILSGGTFGFASASNGSVLLADGSAFTLSGGTFVTASEFSAVQYFTTFGTGDVLLAASTTSTLQVPVSGEQELTRRLTGSGKLIKSGIGTLLLEGQAATHTGILEVAAGTLKLGGQDVLGDGSTLRLLGGTLAANGYAETIGALDLDGNAAINLAGGASTLTFANSAGQTWDGATLAITGYSPGVTAIRFGTDGSALTPAQLAKITVNGGSTSLSSTGFLDTALPPEWTSGWPKADSATSTGFTVRARIAEDGSAYYVVVADGAAAPSVAQVKAGQNASGAPALRSGTLALTANTEAATAVTGLSSNTAYDVYFVAEDTAPNTQTSVTRVDVSTTPDSFTWAVDAAGNWNTASNWSPAAIPNSPAISVTLGPVVTTGRTVTLNQDATLGTLVFNEDSVTTNAYHLAINSGRTLTFDVTSGQAAIQARGAGGYQLGTQGQGTIQLLDTLAISAGAAGAATSEAGTVAISSPISGSFGLVLSSLNSNDGTGTQVSGVRGTLLRSTTGNTFTGGVTVNSGYVKLAGHMGNLGNGTLTLATSNSDGGGSFGTSLLLRAGGGTLANAIAFSDTVGTTGGGPRVGIFAEDSTASAYTLTGPISGTLTSETLRFGGVAPSGNGNTGSSFRLQGDGSALVLNSSTFHIRTGSLILAHPHALGTGNGLGGTGSFINVGQSSNNTNPAGLLVDGVNVSANLRVEPNTNASSGDVTFGGVHTTGSASFSGNITLNPRASGATRTVFLTAASGGTVDFNGVIANGTLGSNQALPVSISGNGTVRLNAVNTHTGLTTVQNGATLGGTGSLAGPLTIADGGRLAFVLATAPASHDRFDAGTTTFAGSSTVTLTALGSASTTGSYVLLRAANTLSGTLPALVLPAGFTGSLSFSGTDLVLNLTAVPFANWAAEAGLVGDEALPESDPDGDGMSNLLEYALGGQPDSLGQSPRPSGGLSGQYLELSFVPVRSDVNYLIEAGSNLSTWTVVASRAAGSASWVESGAQVEQNSGVITVVDGAPTSSNTRRFLRLRMTLP